MVTSLRVQSLPQPGIESATSGSQIKIIHYYCNAGKHHEVYKQHISEEANVIIKTIDSIR